MASDLGITVSVSAIVGGALTGLSNISKAMGTLKSSTEALKKRQSELGEQLMRNKDRLSANSLRQLTNEHIRLDASVEKLTVFRPLIGMDKTEIIEIAKEIETYEKSIEPYEDSCVIFAPKHPVTNPKLEDVLAEEAKIENYDEIMNEIFEEREYFNFG